MCERCICQNLVSESHESSTLGSRGYFFLIDTEAVLTQSAEEKKIPLVTGVCHLVSMLEISSEFELGRRLDTPMSAGNQQYNNGPDWLHRTTSLRGIEKPVSPKADRVGFQDNVNNGGRR